ncbi:IclR family transcriptional regulator [Saccharopolyspora mangrovi]|uniref:IclR family transcriptional regulator n=1 Tax=Saccharopolyspora mangrovi TaxID=3082379 RepID=A0ABU6ADZ4_9PSEU|nr:IclR family transcriptional regulator [Saccharopolyspora sp. S2-29]MEB3369774.1 IclR family transcriptional regulator [Saccharopolyspora sp. S2-29]
MSMVQRPRGASGRGWEDVAGIVELMSTDSSAQTGAKEHGDAGGRPLLVLGKIVALLDAFTLRQPELSLRELQEATGMPQSTVQRLVSNLVAHGFLDRVDDRVRVGVRMAYWGAAAGKDLDVLSIVNDVLRELREVTGETACLFRVEGHQRVCVAVAETRHALRRAMSVGTVLPLTVGSAGRVLLAWSPGLLDEVLLEDLPRMTSETVTDPEELRALVSRTASDGFAVTVGERVDGASGVSAPVFGSTGELVGAVMVHGPTLRLPYEKCLGLVDPVVEHAERITRAMGGRYPS